MKFKIKFAEQIVGFFFLAAILSVTGIIYLMGSNQRWFAKNYYYNTVFESGGGLKTGMPINLSGFKIGQVDKIMLTEDNRTKVIFYIYDTYHEKIKENSIIRFITSPIGLGSEIVFYPGKNEGMPIPEDSFIPSYNMKEAKELIKKSLVEIPSSADMITNLINLVEPMLFNLNRLISSVNETVEYLNVSLRGEKSTDIGYMITNLNLLIAETEKLIAETKDAEFINSFLSDKGRLYEKVETILENAAEMTKELEKFTSYLNSSTPQITNIMSEGESALRGSKKVIEGLSNNPLLRKGISDNVQENTLGNLRDEDF